MVYLAAFAGFITGFLAGQALLAWLLRDYNREQLLEKMKDRGFRLKYGLINWAFAFAGLFLFAWFVKN